jgi:hypothetical protein
MTICRTVSKEVLTNPIRVRIDETLDLAAAKQVADKKASEVAGDPMLLAWYNARTGQFAPNVECCSEEKPGWIVYAESRGGSITVSINEEQFVFIYRDNGPVERAGQ